MYVKNSPVNANRVTKSFVLMWETFYLCSVNRIKVMQIRSPCGAELNRKVKINHSCY